MLAIFLQSLLIGYSGAVMPGTLLTYTLNKSIKSGAKAGFLIALGHSLLELVLVVLLFLGIGKYLGTPPAQLAVGFVGGGVLLFFGVGMLLDVIKGRAALEVKEKPDSRSGGMVAGGALISASNPYFFVWWSAVGLGLMMNAYNLFGILGIALFYIGHILADFSWYLFLSALIGRSRHLISPKVYRIVITVLGFSLLGFGVKFLISAVQIAIKLL